MCTVPVSVEATTLAEFIEDIAKRHGGIVASEAAGLRWNLEVPMLKSGAFSDGFVQDSGGEYPVVRPYYHLTTKELLRLCGRVKGREDAPMLRLRTSQPIRNLPILEVGVRGTTTAQWWAELEYYCELSDHA